MSPAKQRHPVTLTAAGPRILEPANHMLLQPHVGHVRQWRSIPLLNPAHRGQVAAAKGGRGLRVCAGACTCSSRQPGQARCTVEEWNRERMLAGAAPAGESTSHRRTASAFQARNCSTCSGDTPWARACAHCTALLGFRGCAPAPHACRAQPHHARPTACMSARTARHA